MSDTWEAVVGSGSDSGLIGTGKHEVGPKHDVKKSDFIDPNQRQTENMLRNGYYDAGNRPIQQAGNVQMGPAVTGGANESQAAQIGALERMQAANSGGPALMMHTDIGTMERARLAQMQNATIERDEDLQNRAFQMQLANALSDQAQGHGVGQALAGQGYKTANDQNVRNLMAALASGAGGVVSPALAQKALLDQSSAVAAQNSQALVSDKMKAALDAQNQLAAVSTQARGQDIGVNTSQAGFVQEANTNNMNADNQNSMFNAEQYNNILLEQARLDQDTKKTNAAAANQSAQFNAGLLQGSNQFNAGQQNTGVFQDASMLQQTNMANADRQQQMALANLAAMNAHILQQGNMDHATKLANLQASMTQQGMSDEQARFYAGQLVAKSEADIANLIQFHQINSGQDVQIKGLQSQDYNTSAKARAGILGEMIKSSAGVAASDRRVKSNIQAVSMSDERTKKGIKPLGLENMTDKADSWIQGLQNALKQGPAPSSVAGTLSMSPGDQKTEITPAGTLTSGTDQSIDRTQEAGGTFASPKPGDGFNGWGGFGGQADLREHQANKGYSDYTFANTGYKPTQDRGSYVQNMQRQQAPDVPRGGSMGNHPWYQQQLQNRPQFDQAPAPDLNRTYSDHQIDSLVEDRMNKWRTGFLAETNAAQSAFHNNTAQAFADMADRNRRVVEQQATLKDQLIAWQNQTQNWHNAAQPVASPVGPAAPSAPPPVFSQQGYATTPPSNQSEMQGVYIPPPPPQADPRWNQAPSLSDGLRVGTSINQPNISSNAGLLLSDKRQKKDISAMNEGLIDDFLGKLQAYTYDYKNPDMQGAGHGKQLGVMAQDLEQSEIGKSAVKEVNGTKMVDYGKLGGITLAGLTMVDKKTQKIDSRIEDLERALNLMGKGSSKREILSDDRTKLKEAFDAGKASATPQREMQTFQRQDSDLAQRAIKNEAAGKQDWQTAEQLLKVGGKEVFDPSSRAISKLAGLGIGAAGAAHEVSGALHDRLAGNQWKAAQGPIKRGAEIDALDGDQSASLQGWLDADPMAQANRSQEGSAYSYKPEFAARAGQAPGEKNVGPMAQNMKQDPIAATAVQQGDDGLFSLDPDKLAKLHSAGIGSLQSQVDELKSYISSKFGQGKK